MEQKRFLRVENGRVRSAYILRIPVQKDVAGKTKSRQFGLKVNRIKYEKGGNITLTL